MICPNCNGENRDDYKFCAHCGVPRPLSPALTEGSNQPPDPVAAASESPPAAPPDQALPAVPAPKPKKKSRCLVTCLIVGVILLCLAAAALVGVVVLKPEWIPFEIPFDIPFLSSSNRLVIGVPGSGTESDLYLLRQGKQLDSGLLLADDVTKVPSDFFYLPQSGMSSLADHYYPLAAFIPGQDALLYWYSDSGGEITLQRLALDQKTPLTLWQDDATSLHGFVLPNAQDLFFSAAQDAGQHCYLSRAGAAAERVLDGDICTLSGDFSTAFATTVEDGETSVQVAVLPDAPEYTPLDGQENIGVVDLSGDGSRLAYTETEAELRVLLVNSQDASPLASGPAAFAIVDQDFAPRGRIGYFIMENSDGNLELYLLSDSGASLVYSALSMAAGMDMQGSHLVYMAGDYEGERTLYVRDVSSGNDVEVMRGEGLQFQIASPINRIFITTTQEGEMTLYSANVDGSGLVNLHTCTACRLDGVAYVPGQPYIYFALASDEGLSLLAAHSDQAAQFMVVEDWASFIVLDTSADGLQLLYAGSEDPNDDSSLYLAQLDTQQNKVLDDDADGIANALFDEEGSAVLYTALTGSNPDDVEIRRILTDLSKPVEVLYSDAFLVAAQWDSLSPFYTSQTPLLRQSTSYCPGAYGLGSDETVEGSLENEGRDCYQLRGAAGDEITLWVEGAADLDTAITLYDRQGNMLDSDDAGFNGNDPRLITRLPADGIYFVEVSGFGSATGSYTLSSAAGSNYCPGVEIITLGDELSGEMDDEGVAWYGFSGEVGQSLTFWVESTNLDPMLSLYDSQGIMLGNDDNNRDGVDPLLSAALPEAGSYCLEVNTFGFETGPFSLAMVEGTVFCPGADTLDLDQTASGSVADGRRTCYTVDLAADTAYSFAVSSPTSSDTVLELYDSSGSMLVTDDDSGSNLNPLLLFSPDQAGMYYIVIRGYSSGSEGEYELTLSEGFGYCDNPQPIRLGDVLTDYLAAGGDACYTFEGSLGQVALFNVDSTVDTTLTLYDNFGNELMYDDDTGEGLNPQIRTTLPENGTYLLDLRGFGSGEGSYTISFETGPGIEDIFANPTVLPLNTRLRGVITEADYFYNETISFTNYGHAYYFDGTSGQTIQIDVFADSLGSEIDPVVYLFDSNGIFLYSDDDGGTGYDSQLVYILPSSGRYYVIVANLRGAFGTSSTHFYDVLLTLP
jgi:hypothetical protein